VDGSVAEGDLQRVVLDAQPARVGPRAGLQRRGLVEEAAGVGDDLVTTHLVVFRCLLGAPVLGDDIGAVERVIQRAPARVGGVEREPRVQHGHHQLRARGGGDLVVDARGGDGEIAGFGLQVADLG
jgi:hypothetical protein